MKLERTFAGLEITTRAKGLGRFGGAAFLTVWLAFWAVGEVLVLGLLVWGGWSLLTGQPPRPGDAPLAPGPAVAGGLFLIVWLCFWSIGGYAAIREWLRLVFGRARVLAGPDGLTVEEGVWPFATRRFLARAELRRFFVAARRPVLSVQTDAAVVELLQGPTEAELRSAADALRAEYRLSDEAAVVAGLPTGWTELVSAEGEPILVRDPAVRRRQARVLGVVFLVLAGATALLVAETLRDPNLGALTAIVGAFAGFAGWGTRRLARRRDEWVLATRGLRLQVREGRQAEARFSAAALQLDESSDSDGDPYYRLLALRGTEPVPTADRSRRGEYREIAAGGGDPTELQAFGRWLADRTRLPYHDRTTAEAKREDVEDLRRKLRESGRFGRWVADRLPGAKP